MLTQNIDIPSVYLKWVLLLWIICLIFMPYCQAEAVTIGFFNTNAKPYKWTENEVFIGPLLDIMREVSERTEIDIHLQAYPPKRMLVLLEQGGIHAGIGITKKPEREEFSDFVNVPVGWLSTHVFVQKGNEFPLTKIEDLFGKKVGTMRGITYGVAFNNAVERGQIISVASNSYISLLAKLSYGRITIASAPSASFYHLIEDQGLTDKIVKLDLPIMPARGLYLTFSKSAQFSDKNRKIQRIRSTLKLMYKTGDLVRIYRHYGYAYKPG